MGLGVGTGFSPPPHNGHLASWLTPSSLLGSGQKEILGGVRQEGVFRCERVLVCVCVCVCIVGRCGVYQRVNGTPVLEPLKVLMDEVCAGQTVCERVWGKGCDYRHLSRAQC